MAEHLCGNRDSRVSEEMSQRGKSNLGLFMLLFPYLAVRSCCSQEQPCACFWLGARILEHLCPPPAESLAPGF